MTLTPGAGKPPGDGLLERDESRDRLRAACVSAGAGRGSLAVVLGRPGEGKSALLDAACEAAQRQGMRVLRAWGSSLERGFAFGVVRQLFAGVVSELGPGERAQVFSGPARPAAGVLDLENRSEPLAPSAARHGLMWLLVALTRLGPLLLAIDDAHWADEASLAWLAVGMRRLQTMPVLTVLAARPPAFDGRADPLATIIAAPETSVIGVDPLTRPAVATLVTREFGATADEPFVEACERATAGNPLAVTELLRDLQRRGVAPVAASAAGIGEHAPDAIELSVQGRMDRLGPDAVAYARALAVLGERAEPHDVSALAGLDPEPAAAAVEALTLAGILARGEGLRFEHPLVHAAVRDAISPPRRHLLHGRSAALLVARGADVEAVAGHLLNTTPAGREASVDALRAAAAAAMRRGAPDSALAYLERALIEPARETSRAALLRALSVAAWMAMGSHAAQRVETARGLAVDAQERAQLDLMLTQMYYFGGQRERIFTVLDRGLHDLGDEHPGLALELAAMRTTVLAGLDIGWPAADDAEHAALAASAGPGTRLQRELELNLAMVGSACGRWKVSRTVATVTAGFADGLVHAEDPGSITRAGHGLFALVWAGAFEQAATLAERMMADAAARGINGKLGLAANVHSIAQLGRGILADAEASARLSLDLTLRTESRFAEPVVRAALGAVLIERGRLSEAADVLDIAPDPGTPAGVYCLRVALVALHRARGDREAALAQLAALRTELRDEEWPSPLFIPWRSSMAVLTAAEQPAQAAELAEAEIADARRLQIVPAVAVALRARALTESAEEREATLRESVAALRDGPARLELTRSLIALGSHLRRSGRRRDARAPLREALELAHACAAEPLMTQAEDELRAADGRPRRPWLTGAAALTPSELRVARLAASGASNQQIAETLFVTIKTVEMHLTNGYRKLGTSSRAQLPRLLEGDALSAPGSAAAER